MSVERGTLTANTAQLSGGSLTLDVIIPTYNRAALLKHTLESLLAALPPVGLAVQITVVDNNSSDDTPQVVAQYQERFARAGLKLDYLFEPQQGRSHALNRGIAETHGTLIGLIDDDE